MTTYIIVNFEKKWHDKCPYIVRSLIKTKATPRRLPASVQRAKAWAETQIVKETDGKPYTLRLKSIQVDDGYSVRTFYTNEKETK